MTDAILTLTWILFTNLDKLAIAALSVVSGCGLFAGSLVALGLLVLSFRKEG